MQCGEGFAVNELVPDLRVEAVAAAVLRAPRLDVKPFNAVKGKLLSAPVRDARWVEGLGSNSGLPPSRWRVNPNADVS